MNEALHYNKRQQMVDLRLGTVNDEWNWNRGALITYYGTNAVNNWNPFADDTDNNGNVRRTDKLERKNNNALLKRDRNSDSGDG